MATLPHSGIEFVEENEAEGRIASLYEDVRRTMQVPFVPNLIKSLSASSAAVNAHWSMYRAFLAEASLPISMISMILYAVAESNHCRYCSAMGELSCRSYGIDDETLVAIARDLEHVTPDRLRAIIEFAVKVVHMPQEVTFDDFELLRQHGLSDEEIVEIVVIAAVGQFNDILSDTLKIDIDTMVAQALGR
jgi:uncharacterized peroxidase-related enzyme